VGDGGGLANTGAGASIAAASLSATSCVALTVTPPIAVPSSTVRVSTTALVCPSALTSSVAMRISAVSPVGSTIELSLPASTPGIVTSILSSVRATEEPGM
jgi:hypothetical protein